MFSRYSSWHYLSVLEYFTSWDKSKKITLVFRTQLGEKKKRLPWQWVMGWSALPHQRLAASLSLESASFALRLFVLDIWWLLGVCVFTNDWGNKAHKYRCVTNTSSISVWWMPWLIHGSFQLHILIKSSLHICCLCVTRLFPCRPIFQISSLSN